MSEPDKSWGSRHKPPVFSGAAVVGAIGSEQQVVSCNRAAGDVSGKGQWSEAWVPISPADPTGKSKTPVLAICGHFHLGEYLGNPLLADRLKTWVS